MKFEDLSPYDLTLIRSLAIGLLTNTKMTCRYEALSETVLGCIYSKGYKLVPYPDKLSLSLCGHLKSKGGDRPWPLEEVLKEVFNYLDSKQIVFEKDDSREPTWTGPRPSWYTPYSNPKKSWMM